MQKLGLDAKSIHSTEQTYFAYIAVEKELYQQYHTAGVLNGEIVSELESDNPDSYSGAIDILSTSGKELVRKRGQQSAGELKKPSKSSSRETFSFVEDIQGNKHNPEGMPRHW